MIYIDYGNEEIVDEIYKWHPACDKHPIQAITLKMHGVRELEDYGVFTDLNNPGVPLINQIQYFLWDRLYLEHKVFIT